MIDIIDSNVSNKATIYFVVHTFTITPVYVSVDSEIKQDNLMIGISVIFDIETC